MKGIYCFTNRYNNKKYIGQSIQLEVRYDQHKRNCLNPNDHSYNSKFYRALRKYGFENFNYEILIQDDAFTKETLNEAEVYFISLYDSYYNGYNETPGGQYSNNFTKLKQDEVYAIYDDLSNPFLTMREIAQKFNVSDSLISMINIGKVWYQQGIRYPIRDSKIGHVKGEKVNTSFSTDEEIIEIRKMYVNHSLPEIYKKYKNKYSFSGLKKIVYGANHQHLPVYKKREKCWILNGTCIDYPK